MVHALGRMICNNILCTEVGFDVGNIYIYVVLGFSFSSVDHLHYWTGDCSLRLCVLHVSCSVGIVCCFEAPTPALNVQHTKS